MTTPTTHDDAQLWGLMTEPLVKAGHTRDQAEHISRQLIALVRRDRDPNSTTYASGDEQPNPLPQQVADVAGNTWEHQDTDPGMYQLSQTSRAAYGDPTDYDGLSSWQELLDFQGPLTELTAGKPAGPVAAQPELKKCVGCKVMPGEAHGEWCDHACCPECGEQRGYCEHDDSQRLAIWHGINPRAEVAQAFDWWTTVVGIDHLVEDYTRVTVAIGRDEVEWNPETQRYDWPGRPQ